MTQDREKELLGELLYLPVNSAGWRAAAGGAPPILLCIAMDRAVEREIRGDGNQITRVEKICRQLVATLHARRIDLKKLQQEVDELRPAAEKESRRSGRSVYIFKRCDIHTGKMWVGVGQKIPEGAVPVALYRGGVKVAEICPACARAAGL